ncbi:MAG: hypothetical protein R6U58_08330 [Bacteroidales bacterium]
MEPNFFPLWPGTLIFGNIPFMEIGLVLFIKLIIQRADDLERLLLGLRLV